MFLKKNLLLGNNVFTSLIRKELAKSLEERFGKLISENDIFILATMLDPNFGRTAIPLADRPAAINILKHHLIKFSTTISTNNSESVKTKRIKSCTRS